MLEHIHIGEQDGLIHAAASTGVGSTAGAASCRCGVCFRYGRHYSCDGGSQGG